MIAGQKLKDYFDNFIYIYIFFLLDVSVSFMTEIIFPFLI